MNFPIPQLYSRSRCGNDAAYLNRFFDRRHLRYGCGGAFPVLK